LYNLWMNAVWTTLVGFADAATPNDVRFAVPLLELALALELGLVLRTAEPLVFPLPLVFGEAFPASVGCLSARSLPGLLVGGAMDTALVGVMSMASEGEGGDGSWCDTFALVSMGIGLGMEVGGRWSWKGVLGNDSVAAMAMCE
jgi:hypothetical protein